MNTTSISAANVTILREDNWTLWSSQLQKLLGSLDCKRAIVARYRDLPGDELSEDERKQDELIVKEEAEAGEDGAAKRSAEEKRKSLGLSLIELDAAEEKLQDRAMFAVDQTLGDADKKIVANCKTVRQQLAILRKIKTRPQNIYTLNEQLTKVHWEKSETATMFILRLNDLKDKIETARGASEDSTFVSKLIKEMPTYLNWTRLAIQEEIQKDDAKPVEWRALCDRVQRAYQNASVDYEERKEKNRSNANLNNNGRRSNGDRRNGRTDQNDQYGSYYTTRKKCFNCGSEFHLARNCPEPNRMQNSGFRSRYNQVTGRGGQSQSSVRVSNQSDANGGRQYGGVMQPNTGSTGNGNQRQSGQSQSGSGNRTNGADQREPTNLAEVIAQSRGGGGQRVDSTHQRVQYAMQCDLQIAHSYAIGDTGLDDDQFMADDGSNGHVVNDRGAFLDFRKFGSNENARIESVNGGRAQGIGTVAVVSRIKGVWKEFELGSVLLIESSPVQIFSQRAARARGMTFRWTSDDTYDYIAGYAANGDQLINARARINVPEKFAATLYVRKVPGLYSSYLVDFKWHSILSHADYQRIYKTQQCVDGMKVDKTNVPKEESCEPCIEGKDKKRSFDHQLIKSETPGEAIHCDIAEMTTNGLFGQSAGYSSFIVFVDEFSRYTWTYPLKDQTARSLRVAFLECFNDLKAKVKMYPSFVHLDKGTNLMSETIQTIIRELGAKRSNSAAYNHQQNGLAEKTIGDLRAAARAVRLAKNLPARLWPEAINYVAYTNNRVWKRSIQMTPIEALTGKRPNLSHMKAAFGDPVYTHVNNPQERKRLGNKEGAQAVKGTFMGYSECSVIYRVMNQQMSKVTEETGVRFLRQFEDPPRPAVQQRILIMPDQLLPRLIGESEKSNDDSANRHPENNSDTDRERNENGETNHSVKPSELIEQRDEQRNEDAQFNEEDAD